MATNFQRDKLTITWDEVPCGSRDGSINEYLYDFNFMGEMKHDDVSNRLRTFSNLSTGTEYHFSIVASNSKGHGPAVHSTFSTLPGKYVYSKFYSSTVQNWKIKISSGFKWWWFLQSNHFNMLKWGKYYWCIFPGVFKITVSIDMHLKLHFLHPAADIV